MLGQEACKATRRTPVAVVARRRAAAAGLLAAAAAAEVAAGALGPAADALTMAVAAQLQCLQASKRVPAAAPAAVRAGHPQLLQLLAHQHQCRAAAACCCQSQYLLLLLLRLLGDRAAALLLLLFCHQAQLALTAAPAVPGRHQQQHCLQAAALVQAAAVAACRPAMGPGRQHRRCSLVGMHACFCMHHWCTPHPCAPLTVNGRCPVQSWP